MIGTSKFRSRCNLVASIFNGFSVRSTSLKSLPKLKIADVAGRFLLAFDSGRLNACAVYRFSRSKQLIEEYFGVGPDIPRSSFQSQDDGFHTEPGCWDAGAPGRQNAATTS